jgi:hypothetical protein
MPQKHDAAGIVSFELLRRIAARRPDGPAWLARALLEVWWATKFPRRPAETHYRLATGNIRFLR